MIVMPKRPRSHVLETEARDQLREAFARRGWTIEDLRNDYGEDMLVRIFDDGHATPWMFFVQAKATENIERHLRRSGKQLRAAVRVRTLAHWHRLWEPVLLTVWSPQRDVTYWETVQDAEEPAHPRGAHSRTVSVVVPTDNVLDNRGLDRIRTRVISRYSRLESERAAAGALAEHMENVLGVAVDWDAEAEVLIIETPGEGAEVRFVGRLARLVERLEVTTGKPPDELVAEGVQLRMELRRLYANGRRLSIRSPMGENAPARHWPSSRANANASSSSGTRREDGVSRSGSGHGHPRAESPVQATTPTPVLFRQHAADQRGP